jgi:hypothetical protein
MMKTERNTAADPNTLLEAMDEMWWQLDYLLDNESVSKKVETTIREVMERLSYFTATYGFDSPREKAINAGQDYANWEALTVCALAAQIDCTYSDAQGIIEAQEFYLAQSWAKGLTPQETARIIDEKSKA